MILPSVSDETPLVYCIVILSYKHHVVMGVSQTVIIMLLQLFILTPNCGKKLRACFAHAFFFHVPFLPLYFFLLGRTLPVHDCGTRMGVQCYLITPTCTYWAGWCADPRVNKPQSSIACFERDKGLTFTNSCNNDSVNHLCSYTYTRSS